MNTRGGFGVGTLIMLIVVLIMAGGAATVFIQSSSAAQLTAATTGHNYPKALTQPLFITHAYASNGRTTLENITLTVTSSTVEGVAAQKIIVILETQNTSTTYTYAETQTTSETTGTYVLVHEERGTAYKEGLVTKGDLVRLSLQTPRPLIHDEQVRITLLPATGLPTKAYLAVPHLLYNERITLS